MRRGSEKWNESANASVNISRGRSKKGKEEKEKKKDGANSSKKRRDSGDVKENKERPGKEKLSDDEKYKLKTKELLRQPKQPEDVKGLICATVEKL